MIISNHNEELHAQTQIFWAQQGADGFLFLIHSLALSDRSEREDDASNAALTQSESEMPIGVDWKKTIHHSQDPSL